MCVHGRVQWFTLHFHEFWQYLYIAYVVRGGGPCPTCTKNDSMRSGWLK